MKCGDEVSSDSVIANDRGNSFLCSGKRLIVMEILVVTWFYSASETGGAPTAALKSMIPRVSGLESVRDFRGERMTKRWTRRPWLLF